MPPKVVVVVGAGVIGLTTAVTLLEKHPELLCHIVASCMPGDNKTIEYTSPWAGAHHVSHASNAEPEVAALEKETFQILMNEYKNQQNSALMLIDQYEHYVDGSDNGSNPEGLILVEQPGLRKLRPEELPSGFSKGLTFQTLTIDTPAYLDHLAGRFTSIGGVFHRAKIAALSDVHKVLCLREPIAAVVNCTGLGSLMLDDVKDEALYPTRGQLCVIQAPWMKYGKTFTSKGTTSYTIPRSSGLVIVGGTRDADDWHDKARPETTKVILERALGYDRNLLPPDKRANGTIDDIDLVETGCGRRPSRKGGVRLELDNIGTTGSLCPTLPNARADPDLSLGHAGSTPVVHNYGHSGFGWQSSWGFARKATELVEQALSH